jgi:hypothetical protein
MPRPRPVRGHPPPALVTGANGGGALLRGVKGAAQSHRTLAEQFLWDLQEHWQVHGRAALDAMAKERPDLYVQMVARLAQVHRVEVDESGWRCTRRVRLGAFQPTADAAQDSRRIAALAGRHYRVADKPVQRRVREQRRVAGVQHRLLGKS